MNRISHLPLHRGPALLLFLPLLFLLLGGTTDARADPLLISEIVTDPQSDHSENAGGNAVPFDAIPGTGTVSTVDEFIELYNGGAGPIDLRGYTLDFLDSTPSRYVFGGSSAGVLRFSAGSAIDALRPGAFVLLGNPPGALNNALSVELRGPDGRIVDAWVEVDGNATSWADEALTRRWNGTAFVAGLRRGMITPLAPPPAPEPALWILAGLSVLAAARATRRTGARATPRRPRGSPSPRGPRRRGARGAS